MKPKKRRKKMLLREILEVRNRRRGRNKLKRGDSLNLWMLRNQRKKKRWLMMEISRWKSLKKSNSKSRMSRENKWSKGNRTKKVNKMSNITKMRMSK